MPLQTSNSNKTVGSSVVEQKIAIENTYN